MAIPIIQRHRIERGSVEERQWFKFVDPPREPDVTLDPIAPRVQIDRHLLDTFDMALPFALPDGSRKMRMWAITEPGRAATFPAPLVRVRAGRNVHARVSTSGNDHTIHWHGIEPSPMNDGVGKHSFEIKGDYTYQWLPRQPGFFFYHCHKNTPLHFEMGLFGALIVDPPEGRGWVEAYNPPDHVLRYDVEAIWVVSAHDWRWHKLDHEHSLMPLEPTSPPTFRPLDPNDPKAFTQDGILNDWRPNVFMISGAVARNGSTPITVRRVAVQAKVGQTVLVRLLNASYAITECRLGADAQIIAQDGRSYGVPPFGSYSQPKTIPAGTPFQLTTAMRYDMLIRPTAVGTIPFQVDYLDWRGYGSRGRALTNITVTL